MRIAYEPDFGDSWRHPDDFEALCRSRFSKFQGIKHVWDPNGWPFTNKSHQSTLESLSQNEAWVGVNASLLKCARKVLFLRRRNQLARIISDLLGQQTDLWGHYHDRPHSIREAAHYRTELESRSLGPLDEDVIAWYVHHASGWEDQIVASLSGLRTMTVYYEDLFGEQIDIDTRVRYIAAIGEWLGVTVPTDDDRVRGILEPSSKLNDLSSYTRIPNIDEIVSKFGEL